MDIYFWTERWGSVLQQHGLKLGGLPEELNFTEPDLIRSIHRSYIEAGAQGIYANTFGANRHKLQSSKYTVEQIVKQGIKLAREAAEGTDVLVGLDIGSLGRCSARPETCRSMKRTICSAK